MTVVDSSTGETSAPPQIEFSAGLPGFPGARTFTLDPLDPDATVFALRNVEDPELRFIVVPPQKFFPDYDLEIDDATVEELQLDSAEDALVLIVITPGESAEDSTGNLLAPVVVNARLRTGTQMVLSGSSHPLRAPLQS